MHRLTLPIATCCLGLVIIAALPSIVLAQAQPPLPDHQLHPPGLDSTPIEQLPGSKLLTPTPSPTPTGPAPQPTTNPPSPDLVCPSSKPIVAQASSVPAITSLVIRFVDGQGNALDATENSPESSPSLDYLCRNLRVQVGNFFQVDRARQDLRYLHGLGIFRRVDFVTEPTASGVRLVYRLQAGEASSLSLTGGSDEVSGYYGGLGYHQQIAQATQLAGSFQYGTRGHLQVSSSLFSPPLADGTLGYRVYGFNRRTLSSVFDETILLTNGDKVHINRLSAGGSLFQWWGDWQGELGLSFNAISTRDASDRIFSADGRGNPLTFSGTGLDDILTMNLAITIDQRDNPSDPSYGGILRLSSEQSIPLARGNILGNRLLANYSYYWALQPAQVDRLPETLAFNVQAGTVVGDLPPYLAFVQGGPESVRGYDFGAIGSGRSFAQATVEYRFPLFSMTIFDQSIPLGGVLFTDFASDLGSAQAVLGEPGVIRNKPGSGLGVGVGLRAKSPFGLLRTDFGISDQGQFRFSFSFGQRF